MYNVVFLFRSRDSGIRKLRISESKLLGGKIPLRSFPYLRFHKFESRVWANIELVGGH